MTTTSLSTDSGDAHSLKGVRILLSSTEDTAALTALLAQGAAEVHRFNPSENPRDRAVEGWLAELVRGQFDDVVFFSAQGVRLIYEMARQLGRETAVVSALGRTRIIAQGGRASRALAELGLVAAARSSDTTERALLDVLGRLELKGHTVGLQPRDAGADGELTRWLTEAGAVVRSGNSSVEDAGGAEIVARLLGHGVDGVVLSSVAQVAWLWDAALATGQAGALRDVLSSLKVVASESAAVALRDRGVRARVVPARMLLGDVTVTSLRAWFENDGNVANNGGAGRKRLVVVGHGMVSHELCERLAELDKRGRYHVTVLGEEPLPAYDRVRLTSYFDTRDANKLVLADRAAYAERGTDLRLSTKATSLDADARVVLTESGESVPYDVLVLATGSEPFVPQIPGMNKLGVFVYRTIADLERIIDYAKTAKSAAVIGGGLLGLEAAKAVKDLGLETHVVEFAPRLMPRQLDPAGGAMLLHKIVELGVTAHLGKGTSGVNGDTRVTGLQFTDGSSLDVDLVVVSAGIKPRDELARAAGIDVGQRGGIVVNDHLATSDPHVYAIGECVLHRGSVYGLVAPGYEMARALAETLVGGEDVTFTGADMSTKLKLLGVDVASLGDPFADVATGRSIVFSDLVRGVYKKMALSKDAKKLVGAVLVGDASAYASLLHTMKSGADLPESPEDLLLGARGGAAAQTDLPDGAQICSCNNVTKGGLCSAIRANSLETLAEIKKCTRAASSCGGCAPLVTDILQAELRLAGKAKKPRLCEHFAFTRAELFEIVKVKRIRTFDALLRDHGEGNGCEICKPTVASIFASIHNEVILDHDTLQDTNDRYLANIQRGGLYSVIPRIPGGEITPEKLIVIGEVARRFGLYTKITGGQRINLLGAKLDELPEIWEALVGAGFESGHAYGKALRTVKSCVGSSWCRYGVQDSVSFAIRVEERYKGIQSPHKLKSAVSGCTRECAEAQSKDFGIIATEKGWNVYVCGNGGTKPRHADLLASDLDDDTAVRYLDRFIMFYIRTADRLMRTSVWLDKLEGGIEHLKDVVVKDSLGIAAALEAEMQALVDSYQCEWTSVVNDPVRRAKFRQIAGDGASAAPVELVPERGQARPADWPECADVALHVPKRDDAPRAWEKVARAADFPTDGGVAIRHGDLEVAVFNFSSRGEWHAVQNRCPHTGDAVLARGIIGDEKGTPKVACPMHKRNFALDDGRCMSGDAPGLETFAVDVRDGWVYVELPVVEAERLLPAARLVRRGEAAVAVR